MKKGVKLLILVLVLALLGGGYFLLNSMHLNANQTEDNGQIQKPEETLTVTEYDSANVVSFAVEGENSFSIEKDDAGNWYSPEFKDVALDQTKVNNAVQLLAGVKANYAVSEGSAADYGLDAPALTVTLNLKDGSSAVYYIGAQNPVTGDYYFCQKDSDDFYLVAKDYASSFGKGLTAMASVEALPDTTGSNLIRVDFTFRDDPEQDKHFTYYPDGTDEVYNYSEFWFYDSPVYGLMSMESHGFGEDIAGLSSMELSNPVAVVNAENIVSYGLDDPCVTMHYTYEAYDETGTDGEVTIYLSDKTDEDNKRFVMVEGGSYIYRMGVSTFAAYYDMDPVTYLTPVALPLDLNTVESVTVSIGGRDYTVNYKITEREEGSGVYDTTYYYKGKELDEDTVSNWRVFLNNLRAEYADKMSFELEEFDDSQPVATVIVKRNTDKYDTLHLSFYKYDSSFYAADFEGLRIQLFDKNYVNGWLDSIEGLLD